MVSAGDLQSVRLPLTFEQNVGQTDSHVRYLARSSQGTIFISDQGLILTSGTSGNVRSVCLRLLDAARQPTRDGTATGGFANYYKSRNKSEWLEHIPLFSAVRYHDVYPGVDVLFHGRQDRLEYDFDVFPGSRPEAIRWGVEGADRISVDNDGGLSIASGEKTWRLLPPLAYQEYGSGRKSIPVRYVLLEQNVLGFRLGDFDRSVPLTIDPVVQYASVLGLNNNTNVAAIKADASGDLFIAGDTFAQNYPVVSGLAPNPGGSDQVYLTKLNPAGDTILYSTYIPALGFSFATALAIDGNGNAYVGGSAGDPSFPTTSNLSTCTSSCDGGFVAKFSPTGSLSYATLLGDQGLVVRTLTVDSTGNLYAGGNTADDSLKTINAFQPAYIGQFCTSCSNGFFAKLNPTGTGYGFSSYFAGSNQSSGEILIQGIAVDGAGNILVAGNTITGGTPPLLNPWQSSVGTLFLAKFAPDGKTLQFSTVLGSSSFQNDSLVGMTVGTDGTVYLVGDTQSGDFPFTLTAAAHPVLPNQYQSARFYIYATAIKPTLDGLVYSTYLGDGFPNAITLDAANHLHVAGISVLNLLPLQNAIVSDVTSGGFAVELDATGAPVSVSQFGGHLIPEIPTAVATDPTGNVYLAGAISAQNAIAPLQPDPILVGPGLGSNAGNNFGSFIAKISPQSAPQISLNPVPPFLLLRNAGSADLHIGSITLSGGLGKQLGNCGTRVLAGTSCVLTVTNANGGLAAGTVTIASDAQPSVQNFTINLSPAQQAGTPVGDQVYFQDVRFAYPPQLTGTSTGPVQMSISNVGTGSSTINSITVTGGSSQTNNCPPALVAGASCTVEFSVTAGGAQPALHVAYDTNQTQDFFSIFVTPTTTPILLSSQGIDFGTQLVNGVAIPRVVTVTNTSDSSVSAPTVSITGASEFVLAGNTCMTDLAPHQSCVVGAQFNPRIDGDRSGNLNIGTGQVPLVGVGQIASQVQASPPELDYQSVIIGKSFPQSLTLTNTTPNTITIAGISFSLPDYSETDNCAGVVAANNTCTLHIIFDPQQTGARNATVSVQFGGGVIGQVLTLTGTGVTPLDPSPLALNFGSATVVGTTSAPQSVILGNGRQATPQPYTLAITGDFSFGSCPNPMPGFTGCALPISFAPKTPGPQQGIITVSYPGIAVQSTITLSGDGFGAGVSLPSVLDFGNQLLSTEASQTLTLQSSGTAPLSISSISTTGDFTQTNNCGSSVGVGGSCRITISFAPSAAGTRTGRLTVSDNVLGGEQVVSLGGNGTDFELAGSTPGTPMATVSPGQTATYNLGLSESGGFSGVVTLSCSGAPAASTCNVSHTSITVNGPGTVPFAVTVTTTAGTPTSALILRSRPPAQMANLLWLMVLPILSWWLFREKQLRTRTAVATLGLALFLGVVSCGGGGASPSNTPPAQGGTPAGTFTLTVKVMSGGASRQLQLSLTVQ